MSTVAENLSPAARRGRVLLTIGGLLVVAGGALVTVAQVPEVAYVSAPVDLPEPIRFDGSGGQYRVLLLADTAGVREPGDPGDTTIICQAERRDGTLVELDTTGAELQSRTATTLAEFTTLPGETTVACDFADGRASSGYRYAVSPTVSTLGLLGTIALAFGFVLNASGGIAFAFDRTERARGGSGASAARGSTSTGNRTRQATRPAPARGRRRRGR